MVVFYDEPLKHALKKIHLLTSMLNESEKKSKTLVSVPEFVDSLCCLFAYNMKKRGEDQRLSAVADTAFWWKIVHDSQAIWK